MKLLYSYSIGAIVAAANDMVSNQAQSFLYEFRFNNGIFEKEVLQFNTAQADDYIINAVDLENVDPQIADLIESRFSGFGSLSLSQDYFTVEEGEECVVYFENKNVKFSGIFDVSGYYFPPTVSSGCIYYIQTYEEVIASTNAVTKKPWSIGNVVGSHFLCQFIQKTPDKPAEMTQREAQEFCENEIATYLTKLLTGSTKFAVTRELLNSHTLLQNFKNTLKISRLAKYKTNFESMCPSWGGGVAMIGKPNFAINGKIYMRRLDVIHEYGHGFGLWHGGDIQPEAGRLDYDIDNVHLNNVHLMPSKFSKIDPYGDTHSIMGGATITLQASDPKGGRQPRGTVTVTFPFGAGAHSYNSHAPSNEQIEYMFEYRSQFSAREVKGKESGCLTIRLVRSMNQKEPNFRHSNSGNTLRYCKAGEKNCVYTSGPEIPVSKGNCLVEGDTFTDHGSGLTVGVISIDPRSETAKIQINGGDLPSSNRKYNTFNVSSKSTSSIRKTYKAAVRHYQGSGCGGYASSPTGRYQLGGGRALQTFDNNMNFKKWMEDPDYLRMLHRCYQDVNCAGVNFGKDGFSYRRSNALFKSSDPYEWCQIITDISIA
eukprot:Awhi_evm1s1917